MHAHWASFCCSLAIVALLGCSDAPTTHEVYGSVTYDGQLVEQGQISFVPTDGQAPPDVGVIRGGQYSVDVTPGDKRVEIRGSRPLPPERQSDPEMGVLYEDYIPASCNTASTLTLEVSQRQEHNLDLPKAMR